MEDLYSIMASEMDIGSLNYTVKINADHPIFSGHFPGNPVMPGACTIQILSILFSDHMGCTYVMKDGRSVKFTGLCRPEQNPVLQYIIEYSKVEEGSFRLNASVWNDGIEIVKLKGDFCKI